MIVNSSEITFDKIVRSKRKTVGIQITDNATIVVGASFGIGKELILDIVSRHIQWINRKRYEIKLRDSKFSPKKFVNGEKFLLLWESYDLEIVKLDDKKLKFEGNFYLSKSLLSMALDLFIDWYKRAVFKKILERMRLYANIANLEYSKVTI